MLAHTFPMVRHFYIELTLHAIRVSMDWTGLARNIKELCTFCPICQKAGLAIVAKAPLKLLLTIKERLNQGAMDIFGPLKRIMNENKNMLVLMDYNTKWLEVLALRNVMTQTVVNN